MGDRDDAIRWIVLSEGDRARLSDAVRRVLPGHAWVRAAYLYGSAAIAGRPARDVDLGLVGGPPATWGDEALIARGIEEQAGLEPGTLDVRLLDGAPPAFLGSVLGGAVLLYEADREARIRFEVRALSEWLDFQPDYRRVRAEVLRRWARG